MATKATGIDAEMIDDPEIESKLARGEKTTGGFDGPSWVPTLAAEYNPDIKEAALAAKIEKAGKGSTTRRVITGKLVAAHAWGRRMYFLDVPLKSKGFARVKLPESKLLYSGLNLCTIGATVVCRLDGQGKAKNGRKAPWLYTVVSTDMPALPKRRADFIVPESMDEREARREREREHAESFDPDELDGEA